MASPSEAAVLQGPPAETAEEQVAKAQGEPVPAGEELQPGDRRQSGGERIPLHRPTLLESPVLMLTGQQVEPSPSTSLMSYPVPLFQAGRGGGAAAGSGGGGGGGGEPEGPAGSGAFAYPAWAYPRNFIAPSRNRQQQQQQQPPQPPEKPRRESMANDDGYNWRKYGEKQVKGSPYPRSYYKCSHPNCSAKKMIEREPKTGRISQAEFKNEHNHAKPGQVRGQRERAPVPLYGGGTARTYQEDSSGMAKQKQQQQSAMEQSSQDMQQEDAVAALAAMKYSPVMPGMLGAAPHDTPTSLLPIPASLRASTEPEDPQANGWAVPHRLHRSSSAAPAEPEESELSEEAYDSELLDSGVDDDEWQPGEDDYRTEPQSVSDAAAAAAAAVAAIGRRRMHQDTSGLIMLGKRRRGRQRAADSDEEDYDPELYGDDDEVKVLRNMSNGYKHQQRESVELEPPPPKRRSRPSPVVEGGLGAGRRASDVGLEGAGPSAAAAGGGDERSVVELETDADGMDDGFRWRKYGQKIVKGNPHPRSYYKCTHPGCNVRKQVERSGRNARMLVTTYEGTHTHDPPATTNGMRSGGRRGSVQARRPDSAAARPPLPDSSVGMTPAKVLLPSMEQLQQMASGSFPVLLAQPGGGLAFATGGGAGALAAGGSLTHGLSGNHMGGGAARGAPPLPPSLQLALANLPTPPAGSTAADMHASAMADLPAEAAAAIAAAAAEAWASGPMPMLCEQQQDHMALPAMPAPDTSAAPMTQQQQSQQQQSQQQQVQQQQSQQQQQQLMGSLGLPGMPQAAQGLLPAPASGEIAAHG